MRIVQALSDLPGEAWTAFSAVSAAVVGAVSAVLLERIRANKRLDEHATVLGEQLEEVRKLSQPTGNGFANEVTSKLDTALGALEDVSAQVAQMDKRLWDHVSHHRRRLW